MMDKKRERSSNFTHEETARLVDIVTEKKSVLENKKSDAVTWKEKLEAWKAIESRFNCSGRGQFRSAKNLRVKYETLKRDTRKKCSAIRAERYKTGGGTSAAPTLSTSEIKIKEMVLLSVESNESTYDSDQLDLNRDAINDNIESENNAFNHSDIDEYIYELDETDNEKSAANNNEIIEEIEEVDETDDNNAAVNKNANTSIKKKWSSWKPASLQTKKHPALCKPQTNKRPFDKLAEAKIELAGLQKTLIHDEITEKSLKKEMLELEIQHKKEMFQLEKEQMTEKILRAEEMFQLEKEQMLLKKAILKIELKTLKKKSA